jgi:hypothetical protein
MAIDLRDARARKGDGVRHEGRVRCSRHDNVPPSRFFGWSEAGGRPDAEGRLRRALALCGGKGKAVARTRVAEA